MLNRRAYRYDGIWSTGVWRSPPFCTERSSCFSVEVRLEQSNYFECGWAFSRRWAKTPAETPIAWQRSLRPTDRQKRDSGSVFSNTLSRRPTKSVLAQHPSPVCDRSPAGADRLAESALELELIDLPAIAIARLQGRAVGSDSQRVPPESSGHFGFEIHQRLGLAVGN
jgi:hypothetical protein